MAREITKVEAVFYIVSATRNFHHERPKTPTEAKRLITGLKILSLSTEEIRIVLNSFDYKPHVLAKYNLEIFLEET